jgi:hypothetical protein
MMDFLPKHNYYIYRHIENQWFFVKIFCEETDDTENKIWSHGLTHKKIVWSLFRLTGGATGYYLADIKSQKFYYCGPTCEFIKVKLRDLGGLIEAKSLSSNRRKEISIREKLVNPTEEISDCCLVYEMTHINRLRPYDTKSSNFASPYSLQDFGISKGELYKRFISINGGQLGFYVYKPKVDEVLYFAEIQALKQAVSSQ